MDFPVVYTEYGKKECLELAPMLENTLEVINHGVDKATFFPRPPEQALEFRNQFFTLKDQHGKVLAEHADDFIVLSVNRNQPRKDLHRTIAAFKLFHEANPKTFLYILCQAEDMGGNIIEIAGHYDLKYMKDWVCPPPGTYGANQGYPIEVVNNIYNAGDLVVSSTIGEGWGLSINEAFSVKKPVLFPRNTSLIEILGENDERGFSCKSGDTLNDFICMGPQDNNILRPTVNVYDMAEKMQYIKDHYDQATAKAEEAFKWVKSWEDIGKQWIDLFDRAERKLLVRRTIQKIGVNDPCPCGSGIKYKFCCGK
jgi:glycosyltransferase involved in cell wall biosynthesis